MTITKPITRVRYDLVETTGLPLRDVIEPIVRAVRTPIPVGA
jgi:hypothetical protein